MDDDRVLCTLRARANRVGRENNLFLRAHATFVYNDAISIKERGGPVY